MVIFLNGFLNPIFIENVELLSSPPELNCFWPPFPQSFGHNLKLHFFIIGKSEFIPGKKTTERGGCLY